MSATDTTGTAYETRAPSGQPVSERRPGHTYYFVLDGTGSVVMLVDAATGAVVATFDNCPTGNAAGGSWQTPGTRVGDHTLVGPSAASGFVVDRGAANLFGGGRLVSLNGTGATRVADMLPSSQARNVLPDDVGGGGEGGFNIDEALRVAAGEARANLNVPGFRNVAVADYNIGDQSGELVAVSGEESPPGTVPTPTTRRFTVGDYPAGHYRGNDTEVKILEQIAATTDPQATGTVDIYTEREPCPQCRNVIDQFEAAYPNVTVNVAYGP